jgi:hypothetical protein
VANTCNPSYSGQRSGGSQFKASQANTWRDPISKKKSQKMAGGVAQGVDPEFKPSTAKKK